MGKAGDKVPKYVQIRDYLKERYDFRFNTVAIDLEYKTKSGTKYDTLEPSVLECELFEQGFTGFEKQLTAMLKNPEFVERYNPICGYFEKLPEWDKENDYIGMLANYVTTTDKEFWLRMFKKMLVRMIAQAYGTIGFNKQCLVLYGTQNNGKTYFWEHLLQNTELWDYYKKNPDVVGKDGKVALAANFLLNLDELSALSKQDVNQVKATFSESQIKVRLPYDKKDSIMKRKASFVGSTNKREFLIDETGNVRWVVFEIVSINHNDGKPGGYVDVDINKVWAQAYFLFRGGYEVQLNKDDLAASETNNEKYGARSVEYQMLLDHFQPAEKADGGEFFQPYKLAELFTTLVSGKVRIVPENIGRALTKMGVERKGERFGTSTIYGYWLKRTLLGLDGQPITGEPTTF